MNKNYGIYHLLSVVETLRGENGCPWDREQTIESLRPYLIEEAYELLDAIDGGDLAEHREELGDVLLQVALQSEIRKEADEFDFDDVAEEIAEKLIRRHPHVFGDVEVENAEEVLKNWEKIKKTEKTEEKRSVLAGVPKHLPALQKAQRIQSRAAKVGFNWDEPSQVIDKIAEEVEELREAFETNNRDEIMSEFGDVLFAIVNLARFADLSAEAALRKTNLKFMNRFMLVEKEVDADGLEMSECSLTQLDKYWEKTKSVYP
ncbi:MAG: nucleoside triphosphate pyrophosphohydrolase [Kiritimatiellae bacterium]|jgi:MazG family protein|nr:nucleoside triphosphate pyrophosphohydrolase [Kiritimatiellia bacterium]